MIRQPDGDDTSGDLVSEVGNDDAVRAVVRACEREGMTLDVPHWMAVDAGTTRIGPS